MRFYDIDLIELTNVTWDMGLAVLCAPITNDLIHVS